jgi:GGDEF domain-containing protein
MNRHISWAFLGISVAFFLFMVGLTGYRLQDTRTRDTFLANDRFSTLAAKVSSIQSTYVSLDTPSVRKELRAAFDAEPRLLLMCIHSPSDGILYLVTRNRGYLKEPATLSPQWRGIPVYEVSKGYEVALSRSLGSDGEGPFLDAVFIILGREDLYPIVRDDLYLFLAFLVVSGVIILIAISVQEAAPQEGGTREPRAPYRDPALPEHLPDESRGLISPRTGLVWGEHLEPKIRIELEKAVATGRDLALARIRIDEPFADSRMPIVYPEIAAILLKSFPDRELLFDTGIDSFAALIPDADIHAAVRSLESFRKVVNGREIEGKIRSLSIGVTSRSGRVIQGSLLLEEADVALAKASREGGNRVIGFSADPSRYRMNMASTS